MSLSKFEHIHFELIFEACQKFLDRKSIALDSTSKMSKPGENANTDPDCKSDDSKLRKLKFAGCCHLKDEALARLYKIDRLTDEELASVGLQRSCLIDDYRHLHEVSLMWEQERYPDRPAKPQSPRKLRSRLPRLCIMEVKPAKLYKFQLLNQLVKVISFEKEPQAIFQEQQFEFDADYQEDEDVLQLPQEERQKRRFESFCDHLDNMFISGDRNMAIDLVVDALIRLNRRRKHVIPLGPIVPSRPKTLPSQD
ncbi:uncharacterized protein LOC108091306 [Drosophila ficusphila]|uniref:uncharacterized protein LOC108091306 n=1 Tax=Drosophila ficusphila TaxID=30025 RepID=UPI0007E77780|nr:uncharacterized protein LOC108091306 [Drosophila ficusphila]